MANYFVSSASGAGGAGNGSSWANAYLTIAACNARPIAAGDTIFVGDDHNESTGAAININFPGTVTAPNYILVVDHTKASPGASDLKVGTASAGAMATAGAFAITLNGFLFVYGLYINCGVGATTGSNTSINLPGALKSSVYEQCTFVLNSTGATPRIAPNGSSWLDFKNCTFIFNGGAAQGILGSSSFRFLSCLFTFPGAMPTALFVSFGACNILFEGCDLSAYTGASIWNATGYGGRPIFKDCKLPTTAGLFSNALTAFPQSSIAFIANSDMGVTNYRSELYDFGGSYASSGTVVRTGGASMGIPYSWKISTNANNLWAFHFKITPIAIWNTTIGAAVNVTVEGIADPRDFSALPNNDDIWIDLSALQTSTSPLVTQISGTKTTPLATGSALSASTAAWDSAATARANSTAYSVGDIYKAASNSGRLFLCTTAGTSASSEPGGIATAVDGGSVTDGSATFKAMWRFKQTITTGTIQLAGLITVYLKVAKASLNGIYIDPVATLS